MTTTHIKLPYLEDTGLDGKKLYTPRECTERFRHFTKRILNMDIKQILTDDTVPTGDQWDTKETKIRQNFICGAGPSAIGIITKGEFKTDPDTIKTDYLIQLFRENYMPKKNLPQLWRFLLGKTRRQRNTRRTLEEGDNP